MIRVRLDQVDDARWRRLAEARITHVAEHTWEVLFLDRHGERWTTRVTTRTPVHPWTVLRRALEEYACA